MLAPAGAEKSRQELVDQHALAAPAEVEVSVEKLAAYLAKGTQNQEEKARAIFRWLTDRVSYDVPNFLAGHYLDPSPENVLRRRTAVCEGYARLFKALAEEAGLESEMVVGKSKGFGFSNDEDFRKKQADHAWNAVKVDGQWRLLDATWGAGGMNSENKFAKRFNEHWFETRPEQFIYDHFPEETRWQLLARPLTVDQFVDLVRVTSFYFRYGLHTRSHPNAVIRGSGVIEVRLESPPNLLMNAELLKDGRGPKRPLTFVQRLGGEQLIRVMLPSRGRFQLRLFARDSAERQSSDWVMDYQIDSQGGRTPCPGYPKTTGAYQRYKAVLLSPLEGRLKAGALQSFSLRVEGADQVVVGEDQVPLTRSGSTFSGKVKLPASGPVRVYARVPGRQVLDGLLEYSVK